jgi:hypothetical protein
VIITPLLNVAAGPFSQRIFIALEGMYLPVTRLYWVKYCSYNIEMILFNVCSKAFVLDGVMID